MNDTKPKRIRKKNHPIAKMEVEKLVYILSPLDDRQPNLAQVLMLTPLKELAIKMNWYLIADNLKATINKAPPDVLLQARSLLT